MEMPGYENRRIELSDPFVGGEEVDPSAADVTLSQPCRGFWVGTGGDLKIQTLDGVDLTIPNVPDQSYVLWGARIVYQTGTTCSDILAGW